jgi:DNA-binding winged helix-turn-helix (wHTH) protein
VNDIDLPVPTPRVELLRWPDDAVRRADLAARAVPRLLLLGEGTLPPPLADDEDWMFVPADERDMWARMQRLAQRAAAADAVPRVTDGVVLRIGDRSAILSDGEAEVVQLLAARFRRLVTWDELRAALWPGDGGSLRRATSRVSRARHRVRPLGLVIHSVRSRGVVLDLDDAAPNHPHADPVSDRIEENPWPFS